MFKVQNWNLRRDNSSFELNILGPLCLWQCLNSQMCVAGIFENCTFEGLIGGGGSHGPVTSVAQAVTRLQILACHGTPRPTPPLLGFPPRRRLAHLRFSGRGRRKKILLPISSNFPLFLPFRQTLNLISVAQSNITFQKSLISWVRCAKESESVFYLCL